MTALSPVAGNIAVGVGSGVIVAVGGTGVPVGIGLIVGTGGTAVAGGVGTGSLKVRSVG